MRTKSIIIFILIGVLIFLFLNDNIELNCIENFNQQVQDNSDSKIDISKMNPNELKQIIKKEADQILNHLNEYKLNFTTKDLKNLKNKIHKLYNKINNISNISNRRIITVKT